MRSLTCILLLIASVGFAQSPAIPDFRFVRMDNNQEFTQKNVTAGKASLFIFFDVTCSHCQDAIKSFNTKYEQLKKLNIYLVTKDEKVRSQPFLTTHAKNIYGRKNVTFLHDKYDQFIYKFLPKKYPSMFLYAAKKGLLFYSDEPADIPKLMRQVASL